MQRFIVLFVIALTAILLLSACAPAQGFAQKVVQLPDKLQVLIAAGVAWLLSRLLSGRVPDEYLSEISVAITTALITVIGVLLRMIPPEFETIANAVLNLIVVLLGTVWVFRLLRKGAVRTGFLKA